MPITATFPLSMLPPAHIQEVTAPPGFLNLIWVAGKLRLKMQHEGLRPVVYMPWRRQEEQPELGGNPESQHLPKTLPGYLDFPPRYITKRFFLLVLMLSKTSWFPRDGGQFDYFFFPRLEATM